MAAEIRSAIGSYRVMTITGMGGAGKTRLAMQLAADTIDDFEHGVRLVELAAVADDALVADAVAATLGYQPAPDVSRFDTVANGIGDRQLLLVLDNCEHVIDAVHELVQHLVGRCPSLTVLATSRERIGATGEAVFAVPPMAMPGDDDVAAVRAASAVQLFA
ncbi:MAG: NB-ARC domain-containing protein, partial [Pseudomonadota bacterium]